MIRSMTGFGEGQLEEEGHFHHLEIRSVNNRYFKAAIHLPESFAFLETDVERLLREKLTRGSITLRLHIRDLTAKAAQEINTAAITRYVAQLREAAGNDPGATIDLATLATLPGICQRRELTEEERARGWNTIKRLTTEALEGLIVMRATEGQALAADLKAHCKSIQARLQAVRSRVPHVKEDYHQRLASRVRELIAERNVQLAKEDLIKEVAIYAERSDISEELSRLDAHLEQFASLTVCDESSGRKLEFVAQEMLREANTIGSKASDSQVARDIIEIKAAIDRIKEQIQNVE
ncbi:MAG: YicC/YloC family endoribonuclease [Planctomycetota bacterium]